MCVAFTDLGSKVFSPSPKKVFDIAKILSFFPLQLVLVAGGEAGGSYILFVDVVCLRLLEGIRRHALSCNISTRLHVSFSLSHSS